MLCSVRRFMAESSLSSLDDRFRPYVEYLVAWAEYLGLRPVVTETRRSWQRQNELYAQGRTAPGRIVTKAKGGESPHQYGLAADVTSSFGYGSPAALQIRAIAEYMGFGLISWDEPHVEAPSWRSWL